MPLTDKGLVVPRFPEINADIQQSQQDKVDPDLDFSNPKSFINQLNQIEAAGLTRLYELAEQIQAESSVLTATGNNLERIGLEFFGISRIRPAFTKIQQQVIAPLGTTIPNQTRFTGTDPSVVFVLQETKVVSYDSITRASFTINQVNGESYQFSINGKSYNSGPITIISYDSAAQAMQAAYDADPIINVNFNIDVLFDGGVPSDRTEITTDIPVNFQLLSPITLIKTYDGAQGTQPVEYWLEVESLVEGDVIPTLNSLNRAAPPITNLTSTTNPNPATSIGNDAEEQEVYRARLLSTRQTAGLATPEAIKNAILQVEGVSFASIIENETGVEDTLNGIGPYGFKAIVQGGDQSDIARAIAVSKGAATPTFGDITELYTDSEGSTQNIKFSRPTIIYVAARVRYNKYDEELFPITGEQTIAEKIIEVVNDLGIGEDLIPDRFYGALYSAVSGLGNMDIEFDIIANDSTPATDPGIVWSDAQIPVPATSFVQTQAISVLVQEI